MLRKISAKLLGLLLVIIGVTLSFYIAMSIEDDNVFYVVYFSGLCLILPGALLIVKNTLPDKKLKYYCNKCKGTTTGIDTNCGNPECPNQPCCMKPLEECECKKTIYDSSRE